jgi:hypothetical protein
VPSASRSTSRYRSIPFSALRGRACTTSVVKARDREVLASEWWHGWADSHL